MIDAGLSLQHAKLNFMLVKFAYPITWAVEPSTKVQRSNRLQLNLPFGAKEVTDKVSVAYYVILNTGFETKSDFAIGIWYPNDVDSAKFVESFILTLKRKNNPTQLTLTDIYRAKFSETSLGRMYPDLPQNPLKKPGQGLTITELQALHSDREHANFMLRPYMCTFELKFKNDWNDLGEARQKELLRDLDTFCDKMFPGVMSSVLLDAPMQSACDLLYVAFGDHYTEINDFSTMLRTLKIVDYIDGGFGKLTICNHTSRETLESPQDMVRRS